MLLLDARKFIMIGIILMCIIINVSCTSSSNFSRCIQLTYILHTTIQSIQAKAFQSEIQSIRKEFKADVVGISGQGAESKQKFAQELGLDFSILADEKDAVRKEFGVPKAAFGFLPGRVTYVLDKDGVCTSVYDNLADAASHIEKAKEALAEMKPAKKAGFTLPF